MSRVSRQVRLPPGGGAADARGLFWVLDEEVRVEGSSDSMVLERLCAAFEKKGVGAEGKDVRRSRVASPACGLESALVSCRKALIRPAGGGVWVQKCLSVRLCVFSFIHVFIHLRSPQAY